MFDFVEFFSLSICTMHNDESTRKRTYSKRNAHKIEKKKSCSRGNTIYMRQEYKISNIKNNQFQLEDAQFANTLRSTDRVYAGISVGCYMRGNSTQRQKITIKEGIGKKTK